MDPGKKKVLRKLNISNASPCGSKFSGDTKSIERKSSTKKEVGKSQIQEAAGVRPKEKVCQRVVKDEAFLNAFEKAMLQRKFEEANNVIKDLNPGEISFKTPNLKQRFLSLVADLKLEQDEMDSALEYYKSAISEHDDNIPQKVELYLKLVKLLDDCKSSSKGMEYIEVSIDQMKFLNEKELLTPWRKSQIQQAMKGKSYSVASMAWAEPLTKDDSVGSVKDLTDGQLLGTLQILSWFKEDSLSDWMWKYLFHNLEDKTKDETSFRSSEEDLLFHRLIRMHQSSASEIGESSPLKKIRSLITDVAFINESTEDPTMRSVTSLLLIPTYLTKGNFEVCTNLINDLVKFCEDDGNIRADSEFGTKEAEHLKGCIFLMQLIQSCMSSPLNHDTRNQFNTVMKNKSIGESQRLVCLDIYLLFLLADGKQHSAYTLSESSWDISPILTRNFYLPTFVKYGLSLGNENPMAHTRLDQLEELRELDVRELKLSMDEAIWGLKCYLLMNDPSQLCKARYLYKIVSKSFGEMGIQILGQALCEVRSKVSGEVLTFVLAKGDSTIEKIRKANEIDKNELLTLPSFDAAIIMTWDMNKLQHCSKMLKRIRELYWNTNQLSSRFQMMYVLNAFMRFKSEIEKP